MLDAGRGAAELGEAEAGGRSDWAAAGALITGDAVVAGSAADTVSVAAEVSAGGGAAGPVAAERPH